MNKLFALMAAFLVVGCGKATSSASNSLPLVSVTPLDGVWEAGCLGDRSGYFLAYDFSYPNYRMTKVNFDSDGCVESTKTSQETVDGTYSYSVEDSIISLRPSGSDAFTYNIAFATSKENFVARVGGTGYPISFHKGSSYFY